MVMFLFPDSVDEPYTQIWRDHLSHRKPTQTTQNKLASIEDDHGAYLNP